MTGLKMLRRRRIRRRLPSAAVAALDHSPPGVRRWAAPRCPYQGDLRVTRLGGPGRPAELDAIPADPVPSLQVMTRVPYAVVAWRFLKTSTALLASNAVSCLMLAEGRDDIQIG